MAERRMVTAQAVDCPGCGEGLAMGKGKKEPLELMEMVYVLTVSGYMHIYICQNSSNYAFKWVHLFYINYISIKLINKNPADYILRDYTFKKQKNIHYQK